MSNHTKCLICESANILPLKGYESNHIVTCDKCSFVFAQKIPTDKELSDYYSATYTRTDYLSPITIKRYHEILDNFERYRKTGKLLDIGCGVGYFLDVAKERGWEVYGTEYTEESLRINREKGFQMHEGKLDSKNYLPESFDIITSFEVIEHINNPLEEVHHIQALLRKGGVFYCTTPNFNSLVRLIVGSNWNVLDYPEHLSYYTPKSMHFLLSRAGLEKIELLTTGISITRLKKSRNQSITESHITGQSTDENLRVQTESKWYLKIAKQIVNTLLTIFGIGDTLKVLYVKK